MWGSWKTMARFNFLCDFLLSVHKNSCEQFCCMHYILWHLLKVFQFICGGLLELWFSYAQICETRHRMTLPHRNRSITFYMQAKSLRRVRQMEEMFAVLIHYTQQKSVWLFKLWEGFSVKVTHFISVHSQVNCIKIQKYYDHRVYLVYVCE